MSANRVRVALGARAYDIHIGEGLLERAGEHLAPLLSQPRVVVVTDQNVMAAHGKRLQRGLERSAIKNEFITLPPGETTKSFQGLEALVTRLLDLNVERGDLIIAFGGGVIGDLAGFAAAILRRGCRFAQIPTTLLAQVDSAVGGKTAINVAQGKNLVGAFHQPSIVLADTATLTTLPARELRAGYAEIVKYGLIADRAFFEWLEVSGEAALDGADGPALRHAIKTSCAIKAGIIAVDEREAGARALLNFGHTFGHALEAAFGYSDRLNHGEAVAFGMRLGLDYSVRRGILAAEDASRATAHLRRAKLPVSVGELASDPAISGSAIAALMMQDKKIKNGALTLILAKSIGEGVIVNDASIEDVTDFLEEEFAHKGP